MAGHSAPTTRPVMPATTATDAPNGAPGSSVSAARLVNESPHVAHLPGVPGGFPASSQDLSPTSMMQSLPNGAGSIIGTPSARVTHIHDHQLPQTLNNKLNEFWSKQTEEVKLAHDSKKILLPLARIKKIMKSDEGVKMICGDAPVLFAKACEIFILELTHRAWTETEEAKRRTLQRSDISTAIQKTDTFDFLIDIVPRDGPKKEHGVGVMNPAAVGVPVPGVGGMPSVAGAGILTASGVQASIDAQLQVQYYMSNHASYAGTTNSATAAAAAEMMYAQDAPAIGTFGYGEGAYHNPQYMGVTGTGQQQHNDINATPQPQYNQQYLPGNIAGEPHLPPPPQS